MFYCKPMLSPCTSHTMLHSQTGMRVRLDAGKVSLNTFALFS